MSTCVCLAHSAFQGDPDFGTVSGEHKRRRQFSKGGGANLGARNYEYRRRKVFPCVFCKKGWDRNSFFNSWVHKKCGGIRGTLKEGSSFKCQGCDLHLCFKCHSTTGVFRTFCWQKPTTWFIHKSNIGRKWVNILKFKVSCFFSN